MKRMIKAVRTEITLDEAFSSFIQEKESYNTSESTLRNYKLSYDIFYAYNEYTPETLAKDITQGTILKWTNHLRKKEISPSSTNHYLRDLRAFINWMKKRGYIEEPIEIKEIRGQEELPKFFKDEDIEKLLAKPKNKDSFVEWRTWAIVNTVLATGARESTICSMRISSIDYVRKEIDLSDHTKNKKALIIPLSASLENCLREYIRKFELDGFLFPNVGNEQLTTNAVRHSFARYCAQREVEQTNLHGLRHSFARSWVKSGGSEFALQRILGHSNISMTNRYVKLYAEDLKEDYEDFSALDVIKKKSRRTSQFKK